MNKRIKELEKRATEEVIRNTPSFLVTNEMWKEKFAELIIRECMDVVRDINQEYDGGSTVVNAADEIAEHFGVNE